MNLLGSFDRFVAICDDAGIIISLLLLILHLVFQNFAVKLEF